MTGVSTTFVIAKREFQDFFNSKLVLIMVVSLFVTFFIAFLDTLFWAGGSSLVVSPIEFFLSGVKINSCYIGSLLGIVLGFGAFSSEFEGKAMNTLLTKPVYRDTIINGKLLGALGFLLVVNLSGYAFSLVIVLLYFGFTAVSYVQSFILFLPLLIFLSIILTFLGYSLSLLLYLVFKKQVFSLLLSFLIWIVFFYLLDNNWIAGYVGDLFGQSAMLEVMSMAPYTIMGLIVANADIQSALTFNQAEVLKLLLYCFVIILFSYVAYLRSDVS